MIETVVKLVRQYGVRDKKWLDCVHTEMLYLLVDEIDESGYWYNPETRMVEFWLVSTNVRLYFIHNSKKRLVDAMTYSYLEHQTARGQLEETMTKFEDRIIIGSALFLLPYVEHKKTEFKFRGDKL